MSFESFGRVGEQTLGIDFKILFEDFPQLLSSLAGNFASLCPGS